MSFSTNKYSRSFANWLDRPAGRNWLNLFFFALVAVVAYGWLGRPSPSWKVLYSPVGALFIGLPLVGALLSLRSLFGPRIASWARRLWDGFLRDRETSGAGDLGRTDQPIRGLDQDKLGFGRYAALLARRIIDPDEKTPMSIGIHGSWGSGKTGMINLIKSYLSLTRSAAELRPFDQIQSPGARPFSAAWPESCPADRLIQIDFNAWQYEEARALWRALILALIAKHEEMGLPIDARAWEQRLYWSVQREHLGSLSLAPAGVIRAFARALLPWALHLLLPTTWVAWLAGGTKPSGLGDFLQREQVKGLQQQMASPEEFQNAIRSLIANLRRDSPERKIVFFIDDLDRCLPEVALRIVEAIKAFLDIEGCVYVFACDQALLSEGVRAKLLPSLGSGTDLERRGREYLEKLIQVGFEIPAVERTRLDGYCEGLCPDPQDPLSWAKGKTRGR